MPELPEVQTIVNDLSESIIQKKILIIEEFRNNTVSYRSDVENFGTIQSIQRRGKFILIHLDNNVDIVVHLRMTGKLIYPYNRDTHPHLRALFLFEDGTKMGFEDIRTFGTIEVFETSETASKFRTLGVEPLSKNFSTNYLTSAIKNRKTSIKACLLNQSIIAGLGNIYVCEILYRASVHPSSVSSELCSKEIKAIVRETKQVLKEALIHNGTTISDYRRVDDKTGTFQNFLKVYQKECCPKGHTVSHFKQNGRTTYFCEKCQQKKQEKK
jgi:formamidopyrimidine-DNA glycosylase